MTVRDSAVAVGASFQLALVQWASWKLAPTAEWQLLAYDHVIGLPYPQLTRFSVNAGGRKGIVRPGKNGGVGFGGLGANSRGTYAETDAVNVRPPGSNSGATEFYRPALPKVAAAPSPV